MLPDTTNLGTQLPNVPKLKIPVPTAPPQAIDVTTVLKSRKNLKAPIAAVNTPLRIRHALRKQ